MRARTTGWIMVLVALLAINGALWVTALAELRADRTLFCEPYSGGTDAMIADGYYFAVDDACQLVISDGSGRGFLYEPGLYRRYGFEPPLPVEEALEERERSVQQRATAWIVGAVMLTLVSAIGFTYALARRRTSRAIPPDQMKPMTID